MATTLSFGAFVMKHSAFITGDFHTGFVKEHFYGNATPEGLSRLAAVMTAKIYHKRHETFTVQESGNQDEPSEWAVRRQIE